jgi:hypothetical protein
MFAADHKSGFLPSGDLVRWQALARGAQRDAMPSDLCRQFSVYS